MRRSCFWLLTMVFLLTLPLPAVQAAARSVTVDGHILEVDVRQGTVQCEGLTYRFSGHDGDGWIQYPNGTRYIWTAGGSSVCSTVSGPLEGDGLPFEVVRAAVAEVCPGPSAHQIGPWSVLAAFLIGMGLWGARSPESIWKAGIGWRIKGAEPTEEALAVCRVSGVFSVGMGIVILFLGLWTHG